MNKLLTGSVLSLAMLACHAKEQVGGYSIEESEKFALGKSEVDRISRIIVVPAIQKSVYPLPEKNRKGSVEITSADDIEHLIKSQNGVRIREELAKGSLDSFHLIVILRNGEKACVFGEKKRGGFFLEPVFDSDSFSVKSNGFLNEIESLIVRMQSEAR